MRNWEFYEGNTESAELSSAQYYFYLFVSLLVQSQIVMKPLEK